MLTLQTSHGAAKSQALSLFSTPRSKGTLPLQLSQSPAALAILTDAKAPSTAKMSVLPQEKRLAQMADAKTLGYINKLKVPQQQRPSYASVAGGRASPSQNLVPHYVLLFDFDHTLSTEDSGEKLAHAHNIENPTQIFARMKQQDASVRPGGELAAALAEAPEFANITRQNLVDAGQGVRLKANVDYVFDTLGQHNENYKLSLFVLSAGPTETIRTALAGVVPAQQVQGTRMVFDANNHKSIQHVSAGQGKADFIDALLRELNIPAKNLMFAGDGSSDEVAFRYSRERGGFNILVKKNPTLLPLSHAQVYGDDLAGVVDVVKEHIANSKS